MGHERIGILPKTKHWFDLVKHISEIKGDDILLSTQVAARITIENVRKRFLFMHKDYGIKAAFGYLVALSSTHLPLSHGLSSPDIRLEENPSEIQIARDLNNWVRDHSDSTEYAEMACKAGGDTIKEWSRFLTKQSPLFKEDSQAKLIWAKSSDARGFCQLARIFFARLTERYLRYFLERAASAEISSLKTRQQFKISIHNHVELVSRHAFETSKITESFAAGWFNKYARYSRPSDRAIESFLCIAFGKIQEELKRESQH